MQEELRKLDGILQCENKEYSLKGVEGKFNLLEEDSGAQRKTIDSLNKDHVRFV